MPFSSSFFYIYLIRFSFTFSNLRISCFWACSMSKMFLPRPLTAEVWEDWVNFWEVREGMESSCRSLESLVVVVA